MTRTLVDGYHTLGSLPQTCGQRCPGLVQESLSPRPPHTPTPFPGGGPRVTEGGSGSEVARKAPPSDLLDPGVL